MSNVKKEEKLLQGGFYEEEEEIESEEEEEEEDDDNDSYDDDGIVKLITQPVFKQVCSRHDFSKVYKDARSTVNRLLLGLINRAVADSMLEADARNQKTLTEADAIAALEKVREIPQTFH